MKPILTTILVLMVLAGMGQSPKWKSTGYQDYRDTTTKTYSLIGKDSISFHIGISECDCTFYIDGLTKKRATCKGLKRAFLETIYWNWQKDSTIFNGKKIRNTKPHWNSNMSGASFIQGTYFKNGKQIYPEYIFIKDKLFKID